MKTADRSRPTMHRHFNRREAGITLLELLVGVAVGLFLLSGLIYIYTSTIRSSTDTLDMTRMDQQLAAVADVITRNVRRAGYHGKIVTDGSDVTSYGPYNPFQTNGYELILGGTCASGVCDCATFSYDADNDGAIDNTTSEIFGFRLYNGAIEMRSSGTGAPTCPAGASADWTQITDNYISVTSLKFAFEQQDATTATKPLAINLTDPSQNLNTPPAGCPVLVGTAEHCLQVRTLVLEIDAQLASDAAVTQSLRQKVRVQNDRYCNDAGTPSC